MTKYSDTADRIVMVSVKTPGFTENGASPELVQSQRDRMHAVADKLRAMAGVQHVAFESAWGVWNDIEIADRNSPSKAIILQPTGASPEYFDAMGLPIIAGRAFRASELVDSASKATQIPVIVGTDLASTLWGSGDPLGRRIEPLDSAMARRELIVVGVVDDPQAASRQKNDPYEIYFPSDTTWVQDMLFVRTALSATPLLTQIRTAAQEAAPGAVIGMRTFAQENEDDEREIRRIAGGVMGAGALALLLSALGLYAVVSFAVGQRTQEIAVRMSLGARSGQIARAIVGEGLRLGGIGLMVGLPFGVFALFMVRAQMNLEGMPIAPVTVLAAVGVLLVAAMAAWMPARRAAGVNPAASLR